MYFFYYYYLFFCSRFADIVPMSSISTQNASSLLSFSSSTPQWKYDVFLSFRGEDTYNSFTNHLYVALKQKGIFIFRDEEKIKRGKSISPEFLKAIEESRFVIVCVVFCSHPHHQIPNGDSLSCWLVANGEKKNVICTKHWPYCCFIGSYLATLFASSILPRETNKIIVGM